MNPNRIASLKSDTIMVGAFHKSALEHPANYPEFKMEDLIGVEGFRAACALHTTSPQNGQGFLFHESQVDRINYRYALDS